MARGLLGDEKFSVIIPALTRLHIAVHALDAVALCADPHVRVAMLDALCLLKGLNQVFILSVLTKVLFDA
jgi:hypothetical protein